ncbi:MAG: hypothetical protein KKD28_07150 [Chloroflexi bacterium]|nr:hypothetical protein [Chloroflexota bacterium]
MNKEAIRELDTAALAMINLMKKYGDELEFKIDASLIKALNENIANFRRLLMGMEMGVQYQGEEWDQ